MLKKLLLTTILILTFVPALALAESDNNPTVQITSYKKLYTGQILAFGSGSGTLISSNGLIISNNHVIFNENEQKPLDVFEVCITFDVEKEPTCQYTARLVAHSKDLDISILKLNSKDAFGRTISSLKYLNYQTTASPKEEDEIQVIGYPGSGGESITITKGQISGYDTYNEFKYYKTDTDFDFGSSGGTVLDANGNYIGIPTYIRSYAENVGYFLDLREALQWIKENISKSPVFDKTAEDRLIFELARLKNANDTLKHTYADYPKLSVEIPDGWRFWSIEDDGIYIEEEKLTDPAGLGIYLNFYQYKIDEGYLDKLDEELSKVKEMNPDYKKEEIEFNGYNAFKITYSYYNSKRHSIYIPYGYAFVGINYSINLNEEERQTEGIEKVLKTIKLNSNIDNDPNLSDTISFDEPGFSITMPENWRIQTNKSNTPMNLIAEVVQEGNYDGYIYIYYDQIPKGDRELSNKDRADEDTKYIGGGSKLIFKKDDVVLDGLEGYLFTYEYEGDDFQEMRKKLTIKLTDEDYEFTINYDDLSDNFDENLHNIELILNSFVFTGREIERKGEYDFGSLNYNFSDIQYHRYVSDITDLADKGIIEGYSDGTFKPEKLVNRAEALKIILASKNHMEEEKGLGNDVDFSEYDTDDSPFWDVKKGNWFNPYIQYAYQNEIVSGYGNSTFGPERTVNLVEALKMVFGVYKIPLWQGETNPWYKLYMDKGYELGLVGRGMENPGHELTRAELADLVNDVYNDATNSYSYY
jgi:V8-like Glu-specific endopeptidase